MAAEAARRAFEMGNMDMESSHAFWSLPWDKLSMTQFQDVSYNWHWRRPTHGGVMVLSSLTLHYLLQSMIGCYSEHNI